MRCQINKKLIRATTIVTLSMFLIYFIYAMITHTTNLCILIILGGLFTISYIVWMFYGIE